ncbi:hypothetical protein ACH5RR_005231 [Cinchona calisaya]|uniref:Alpha 1,4-glycosyltransferase domain-containing protein n=1 Tax=Cinchona calisaya TaxID=153742 RepID=A0ABD3AKK7_9GENT
MKQALLKVASCEAKSNRRAVQIMEAEQPVVLLESFAAINEAYSAADHVISSLPAFSPAVKEMLPDLDMFNSTGITRQFDARLTKFLDGEGAQSNNLGKCQVHFFMTWISPASSFGTREFVVMESIFKENHNACLIILTKTLDSPGGRRILKPLLELGYRVVALTPDLSSLFKNTPAEAWFNYLRTGKIDPGKVPLAQNLSNLIRLAVLYKYGGVYLDTDFIVLRDFSMLRNVIGAQSVDANGNWTRLNNAVLVFDKKHPLLYEFMQEFQLTFDGNSWGHNGPYLVSRVVYRLATNTMTQDYNFTVLPPIAFYPVGWIGIDGFFKRPSNPVFSKWASAKLRQLNNGETYGVHLWNRQTGKAKIEEGSIIATLISDHCIICQNIFSS